MINTLLLNREVISKLLSLEECIEAVEAVEAAFAAHARGLALEPGLLHVHAERGEFHIKAGGLKAEKTYFATKINGGFFHNRADFNLPNILGLILLFDGTTGVPLAVMESGLITRLRTAAATAVAAKYLAKPSSKTLTICGAGIQAEAQVRALMHVFPLERVFIWSRTGAETLCKALEVAAEPVEDLYAATKQSDIIVTCTPSKKWFLGRGHVNPGTFIAAVGADSPEKQEIEPALLAQASIACDLLDQAAKVGDLHHAIKEGLMRSNQVRGELGAIIVGQAPKRIADDEIIIFDSTGTALQDTAAAIAVYRNALELGCGKENSFSFV